MEKLVAYVLCNSKAQVGDVVICNNIYLTGLLSKLNSSTITKYFQNKFIKDNFQYSKIKWSLEMLEWIICNTLFNKIW